MKQFLSTFVQNTALVVWGTIGSFGTSFNQRWTKAERNVWILSYVPEYLLGVIVGLILSDASLQKTTKRAINARLIFGQSTKHIAYFSQVFWLLAPLCIAIPYISFRKYSGSVL